jgi:hypothetical protein
VLYNSVDPTTRFDVWVLPIQERREDENDKGRPVVDARERRGMGA